MNRSGREASAVAMRIGWLLVLVIATVLRLWQLHLQILIDDEWHALHRLMQVEHWREIALSFGLADYSIPLTLLFNALFETVGLHEWHLRFLPLVFGLAGVFVLPALLRPWLDEPERLTLALLLALSPLLIHFSRQVRPYALVVVLGFLAVIALWRWWHERDARWLWAFVPAAVLGTWLHALTAVFIGAALTWFGVAGLVEWWREAAPRRLLQLLAVGLGTVAACSALVLPPLLTTPQVIGEKAGVDQIQLGTLLRSWELFVGTAQPLVAAALAGLAIIGAWHMWRRDRGFLLYWLWMVTISLVFLALMQPAWIQHALVLVRYNLLAQPVVLAWIAIGVLWLGSSLRQWFGPDRPRAVVLVMPALLGLLLYLHGPLPDLYRGINQFTNATRYQFDYDEQRTPFAFMTEVEVPAFYRTIAEAGEDLEIIETPWHFESSMTVLFEYQQVHQRRVRIGMMSGLCTDWTWGEIRPAAAERIRLPQFVFLADLLEGQAVGPDRYVVFHRRPAFDEVRDLPPIDDCLAAFEAQFGPPWYDDADHVVFRLAAAGAGGE